MHLIYPLHQWPILHHPEKMNRHGADVRKYSTCQKSLYGLMHNWLLFVNHNKLHCESKVITLPMPSAVCSARTSLRTLTASLRVAGRQLQSTTSANPSTTCSTPDRGLRSTDREWPLPEACLKKKHAIKITLNFSLQFILLNTTEPSTHLHVMALIVALHCLPPLTDELQ